jgi:hypothetical protein
MNPVVMLGNHRNEVNSLDNKRSMVEGKYFLHEHCDHPDPVPLLPAFVIVLAYFLWHFFPGRK